MARAPLGTGGSLMRALTLIAAPVVAVLVFAATMITMVFTPPPASATPTTCQATLGPWPSEGGSGRGAADAAKLDQQQRKIVTTIITIGKKRGLSPRAWQIAIQAGMTESRLRNLPGGHADSMGIFQMRPSMGWGTPQQLQDISYQINKFYDVLLTIEGWQTMRPGRAAQAVERSAFPARYHRWEAMAAYLISQAGVGNPTGCATGPVAASEVAQTVIAAAKKWLGTPYAWGGGNAHGPTMGSPPDAGVIGFDCSGLTLYAYAQAGITIPRLAAAQYHAGAHVPFEQARPGDLVFWSNSVGNPAAIHHVAIYLGHNKVIHAPHSGTVVQISTIWHNGLVPTVTRPGVQP